MPRTVSLNVVEPWVQRLAGIIARQPLCLGIETINICDAQCVFCAYPKMKRAKVVLEQWVFEKAVRDYAELGGGAIRLTPTAGENLLDPHLLERLRFLRSEPKIGQVYFVTNGIGWERYSADEQKFILESVDWFGFSLGGLDAESYKKMYRVDRFEKVRRAIHSVCDIKGRHNLPVEVQLFFRVTRSFEELTGDPRLEEFRRPEVNRISGSNQFLNWGGIVTQQDLPSGAELYDIDLAPEQIRRTKKNPCFMFYLEPTITSGGLVSACGCQNAEAVDLILGDIREHHLGELWNGEAFNRYKASFGTDDLAHVCKVCTLYKDGEEYIRKPALARFKLGDIPYLTDLKREINPAAVKLSDSVMQLWRAGRTHIALYGAGRFARRALVATEFEFDAYPIVALMDDDEALQGERVGHLCVASPEEAQEMSIDAVLMCVECRHEQMIKRAEARWGGKVPVFDLDGRRCTSPSRQESLTENRMTSHVLQKTERPCTH